MRRNTCQFPALAVIRIGGLFFCGNKKHRMKTQSTAPSSMWLLSLRMSLYCVSSRIRSRSANASKTPKVSGTPVHQGHLDCIGLGHKQHNLQHDTTMNSFCNFKWKNYQTKKVKRNGYCMRYHWLANRHNMSTPQTITI
jgi:hypothetical protein